MRIEDIEDVSDVDNDELYRLRLVAMQQWQKADNRQLSKDEIITKYKILKDEIDQRQMIYSPHEMDRILADGIGKAELQTCRLSVIVDNLKEYDIPMFSEIAKEADSSNLLKARLLFSGNVKDHNLDIEISIGKSSYNIGSFADFREGMNSFDIHEQAEFPAIAKDEHQLIMRDDPKHEGYQVAAFRIDRFVTFRVEDNLWDVSGGGIIPDGLYEIGEGKISKKVSISKPGLDENDTSFRYRLRDPGDFTPGTWATITIKETPPRIMCVIGKLKGQTTTTKQNYIFPKEDGWTKEKVQEWLKDHVGKSDEVYFRIMKKDETEYIVGGVIYEPDTRDTQGDYSTTEEIWKALKSFMINKGSVKIQHAGKARDVPVVECYFAESDTKKWEKIIKSGTWIMSVYLGNEKDIWDAVVSGELTGFSMAGMATKG